MKKFLIAVIVLIPIIIVLAIMASSAIITATGTPINPTSMTLKDVMNEDCPEEVELDLYGGVGYELTANVYPTIAQDKSVSFIRQEDVGTGEVEFQAIGANTYRVVPKVAGVAQYIVRVNANIAIYKVITFNITSDVAENVVIYDMSGGVVKDGICITEATYVYVETDPISAMQKVSWDSGDTSVVQVDANGKLYPVGSGKATVQAHITDKKGNLITKSFYVDTTRAVAVDEIIYCAGVADEEWVLANAATDPNSTTVKRENEDFFTLTREVNGETLTASVAVLKCEESAIGFLDDITEVYLNSGNQYLEVGYLTSKFSKFDLVEFSSDDIGVLSVSAEGEILPMAQGRAKVTATFGSITVEKVVVVRERPAYVALTLSSVDAHRGIENTRVWGVYTMVNQELSEGVSLGLKDANATYDVAWSTTGSLPIAVDESGKSVHVTFGEGDLGKDVTVTATLRLGKRLVANTSRSFTYKVMNTMNSLNIYDLESYEIAMQAAFGQYDLAIQTDLYLRKLLYARSSIYGNGFTFYGENIDYPTRYSAAVHYEQYYMRTDADGNWLLKELVVQNLHIIAHNSETFDINKRDNGYTMKLGAIVVPVYIRYCELEYGQINLEGYLTANINMEGCIIGDAQKYGMSFQCGTAEDLGEHDCPYRYTFKNMLFKKCGTTSIGFATRAESDYNANYMPETYFEGFCDCYNWKRKDEIAGMFTGTLADAISTADSDLSGLTKILADALGDLVEKTDIKDMIMSYKGEEYICPCVMVLGTVYTADISKVHNNTTNLKSVPIDMKDDNGEPIAVIQAANVLIPRIPYFESKNVTSADNPSLLLGGMFTNKDSDIYPDSAIPASEELYAKLRNEV